MGAFDGPLKKAIARGLRWALDLFEDQPGEGSRPPAAREQAAGPQLSADAIEGTNVANVIHVQQQILVASPEKLAAFLGTREPPEDLRTAVEVYLKYLVDKYYHLDLKGMGITDQLPIGLVLRELYVPLKARSEMPRGEAWSRFQLAGREIPAKIAEHLSEKAGEAQPLLELLEQRDGLVVLGDPGSGKTTFLKYLALEAASAGAASPRLPILLPFSAYANALAKGDVALNDFIPAYFRGLGAELPMQELVRTALKEGRALVLLDGLDEVKDESLRATVVGKVDHFYALYHGKGNKFVLTSRIVGYKGVRFSARGLQVCTLVDFDDEEIESFVGKWTTAIEKAVHSEGDFARYEADRERDELLDAVARNPGVRSLAANPLMLTILALMKRQGISLPDRRVELYQTYVVALLSSWNRARSIGRQASYEPDVTATLNTLAPLALWMHTQSPGVGLVPYRDLRRELIALIGKDAPNPDERADAFLADVRAHASLLIERGFEEYGFIHLTFEEYLAAYALAKQGQQDVAPVVGALCRHTGEQAWREVTLLTVGYMTFVQNRDEAASALVQGILESTEGKPGEAVVLAGEAVGDVGSEAITEGCRSTVTTALLQQLRDPGIEATLRARAGAALADIGESRPEVTSLDAMPFCLVPGGDFQMGEAGSEHAELHLNSYLTYDYWIGRFPVTVAQFREYVKLDEEHHQPDDSDALQGDDNCPVVWVSWDEAMRFCVDLTAHWHDTGRLASDWCVRLPSEAEWEKAARGGRRIPQEPAMRRPQVELTENLFPEREYPWGDGAAPDNANYDDTGIGKVSAVGCFPGGRSPYGCEEMAGNVWEWTRSVWGKESKKFEDMFKPQFKYPYIPNDGRENKDTAKYLHALRGGAFFDCDRLARCAYRYRYGPNGRSGDIGFRVVLSPFSGD